MMTTPLVRVRAGETTACTLEQAHLGEGVRWDERRRELLRVDVLAGRIYRSRVAQDGSLASVVVYEIPGTVGAISPVRGDDGWLLAAGRGFVHLAPNGTLNRLADVVSQGARMNDAACDPLGRCWAGTLADDHHAGGGALHRIDRDGRTETMLDGLTIPNGIGWSPDGSTMYLVDSGPRVVDAFDFDVEHGTFTGRRDLIEVAEQVGAPDGLTVDAAGDLWVAIYGGGRVRRYSADGVLREEWIVPAEQTTCCAFAGAGLHRMYVTTATENWTVEQRRAEPGAGLVYRFDTDATGRPAAPFVPSSAWWTTTVDTTPDADPELETPDDQ